MIIPMLVIANTHDIIEVYVYLINMTIGIRAQIKNKNTNLSK